MEVQTDNTAERIQELERDIAEKRKELLELLNGSARGEVANYELTDRNGNRVRLSELFGDKDDLIVIHNMGASCPYCTLWADGFNGVVPHLENRAAFVVVSPDSPEVQQKFAESRNWSFRMYSDTGSDFSRGMGYLFEKHGQAYQLPGVSAFRKRPDGTIVRTGRDSFGPGDVYSGIWHLFALLENGAGNWEPQYRYS